MWPALVRAESMLYGVGAEPPLRGRLQQVLGGNKIRVTSDDIRQLQAIIRTLKIEADASPKHIVELVVFINPGETTFSVINIVAEDVHPRGVVAIATTFAPFGIKIAGNRLCGSKIFVELL